MLLLHPFIIGWGLFIFDLEFFWFLDKDFRLFDLLYSIVSFGIFTLGILLLVFKFRIYITFVLSIVFIFYQVIFFGFSGERYLSKVEVSSEIALALISYDVGALSSNNFVKLEKFEKKFLFFVARKELKQFSSVKYANVNFSQGLITIDITSYDNSKIVESIKLKDI